MHVSDVIKYYKSKFGLLPEKFESPLKTTELVPIDRYAYDYVNDVALALGVEYVMNVRLFGAEPTYFYVVNVGAPHLPIIGCMLKAKGVDCYFYLHRMVEHEYLGHFGFFAHKYKAIKIKKRGALAMMFNAHSPMNRNAVLPLPKKLKSIGVEHVIILVEHNAKPLNREYSTHPDFEKVQPAYKKHFDTMIIEVDPRPRKSDYGHVVKFVKQNDALIKLLSRFLGKDEKETWKIIRYGSKVFH